MFAHPASFCVKLKETKGKGIEMEKERDWERLAPENIFREPQLPDMHCDTRTMQRSMRGRLPYTSEAAPIIGVDRNWRKEKRDPITPEREKYILQ